MNLRQLLLERAFLLAQEIGPEPGKGIARGEELGALTDFVHLASAAGFLSGREHAALVDELGGLGLVSPGLIGHQLWEVTGFPSYKFAA